MAVTALNFTKIAPVRQQFVKLYVCLQYTINVAMNAQDVPLNTKNLSFTINATSVGNEVNAYNNYKELLLPIRIQADMTITG